MVDFATQTADPFGLGVIDDDGIVVTDIVGGPRREQVEVLAGNAKYIEDAVVNLRPIEEWSVSYELRVGTLTVPFGALLNSAYLVTSFSASTSSDGYPTASVTAIKPSAAGMIKAYPASVTLGIGGGFGVVEKFGMTSASSFISTGVSISMLTAEAMHETSGDFETAGIYHYGFKQEVTGEAYATITLPGDARLTDSDTREGRDSWTTYAASWWRYLDAI